MLDGGYNATGEYTGRYDDIRACYSSDGKPVRAARAKDDLDNFLDRMANTGSYLSKALFGDEAGQKVLRAILQNANDGSVLQIWIDRRALDFVFPWAWLYDGPYRPGSCRKCKSERVLGLSP